MEGNEVVCGDVFRRIGFQQNVEEAQSQDSALSRGARVEYVHTAVDRSLGANALWKSFAMSPFMI